MTDYQMSDFKVGDRVVIDNYPDGDNVNRLVGKTGTVREAGLGSGYIRVLVDDENYGKGWLYKPSELRPEVVRKFKVGDLVEVVTEAITPAPGATSTPRGRLGCIGKVFHVDSPDSDSTFPYEVAFAGADSGPCMAEEELRPLVVNPRDTFQVQPGARPVGGDEAGFSREHEVALNAAVGSTLKAERFNPSTGNVWLTAPDRTLFVDARLLKRVVTPEQEPTPKFKVGDRVLVKANPTGAFFDGPTYGRVLYVGTNTVDVDPEPGSKMTDSDTLRSQVIAKRDVTLAPFKVGDRVRVAVDSTHTLRSGTADALSFTGREVVGTVVKVATATGNPTLNEGTPQIKADGMSGLDATQWVDARHVTGLHGAAAEVAPEPEYPTFSVGDRVRVATGAATRPDGTGLVSARIMGQVGVVEHGPTEGCYFIRAVPYPPISQYVHAKFLTLEPGPVAEVLKLDRGTRVKLLPGAKSSYYSQPDYLSRFVGQVGIITGSDGEPDGDGDYSVKMEVDGSRRYVHHSYLEEVPEPKPVTELADDELVALFDELAHGDGWCLHADDEDGARQLRAFAAKVQRVA